MFFFSLLTYVLCKNTQKSPSLSFLLSMVSSPKLSNPPEPGRTKPIMGRSSVISAEITTLPLAPCHSLTSRSNDAKSAQA